MPYETFLEFPQVDGFPAPQSVNPLPALAAALRARGIEVIEETLGDGDAIIHVIEWHDVLLEASCVWEEDRIMCAISLTERRSVWDGRGFRVDHRCCPGCEGAIVWVEQPKSQPRWIYVCLRALAFHDPVLFRYVCESVAEAQRMVDDGGAGQPVVPVAPPPARPGGNALAFPVASADD